ncbi:MAG: hypothetical protein NT062_28405 [Proteobacteria bacterium]|nr:hypothetical protein [Pseudomonadota bacterium]
MAIDYVLAIGCEPQRQLGVERLVTLHRTRIIARSAIAHMRQDGDDRDPSEIEVQLTMRKPDGDSARGVTLQDLVDESAALDTVADHCATCPAKLPREFACHRRIRYPIPEHVEQWLMGRLPRALATTAGALLVRGLGEFDWDGAPTAKLRAAGETYFESRAPYGVRWEADDKSTIEISADQLFQMMFMVGHIAPTHSLMLALFFGAIPHDTSIHDLTDKEARTRILEESSIPPEPDADVEQLAAFLRTLALAARLEATILVDG